VILEAVGVCEAVHCDVTKEMHSEMQRQSAGVDVVTDAQCHRPAVDCKRVTCTNQMHAMTEKLVSSRGGGARPCSKDIENQPTGNTTKALIERTKKCKEDMGTHALAYAMARLLHRGQLATTTK